MAIQTQRKTAGGLVSAVNSTDSKEFAKKAYPFIKKEHIIGTSHQISIPEGATIRRERSGAVYFFRYKPEQEGIENGYRTLPPEAKAIQYPEFSVHGQRDRPRYIDYREPLFYFR